MRTPRAFGPALLLLLSTLALPGSSLAGGELPEADLLARAVLESNPELLAIEAQIEAMEAGTRRASVWSDPMLATEYSNMAFARPYPGGHAMSGVQLRLQQTIPFPGKIAAREAAAEGRVLVTAASLPERQNLLIGAVRTRWVQLGLTRQLRRITRSHIELLSQLAEVVQVRTEVGKANQVELQRLLLLRRRLEDDLGDFDRDEALLLATLNASLHRPAGTLIETLATYPRVPAPASLEVLVASAHSDDPALARLRATERAEQLETSAARSERRPDVTAWAGYRFRGGVPGGDPGEDFFSVGASIPLPWFWNDRRWGALEATHDARGRVATAQAASRRDQLRGAIEAARVRLARAIAKGTAYRDHLVPKAHAVLDATFAVYPTGKAQFESVFQAELQLLDFERGLRLAEAEGWAAHYELRTLTAENLTLASPASDGVPR